MKRLFLIASCLSIGCINLAAAETPQGSTPVSRAEYNKLKSELKAEFEAELKAQREQFKKELSAVRAQMGKTSGTTCVLLTQEGWKASGESPCGKETPLLGMPIVVTTPGTSKLTLTGGASSTFISEGGRNAFFAEFNPIFLWEINDRLRFEGDVDFRTGSVGATSTEVQTAELSLDLCDYLTLGAGRFANPSSYFLTDLRKDWVNKLPTAPLSPLPSFEDGAQIRGEVPIGSTLLTYAAFAGQSPLSTPNGYNTWPGLTDVKTELEVGGHVGFEPIPGLEIGYGLDTFHTKGDLDHIDQWYSWDWVSTWWGGYWTDVYHYNHYHYDVSIRPVLQTADLNFFRDLNLLKGTIDFHAQWTWLNLNTSDFPDQYRAGVLGNAQSSYGGYAQLSYRPTHLHNFLANFEPVFRYEYHQDQGGHLNLWTFGLDYWLTDRTLLKAAYQKPDISGVTGEDDIWMLQFATGF